MEMTDDLPLVLLPSARPPSVSSTVRPDKDVRDARGVWFDLLGPLGRLGDDADPMLSPKVSARDRQMIPVWAR